jgi:tyrosine-protein kinase
LSSLSDYPRSFATSGRGGAAGSYLRAIRSHLPLVVLIIVVEAVVCIVLLAGRQPTYTATAKILVQPLAPDDRTFIGIDFIRDSADPTRTIETAASVVDSPRVAAMAAKNLGPGWTGSQVRAATTVTPEGASNILDVQAKASTGVAAARIANEFTRAVQTTRRQNLAPQIAAALARTRSQLAALGPKNPSAASLGQRLDELNSVSSGRDPTVKPLGPAAVPTSASGAPKWLVVLLATLAAFTLAAVTAIVLELVDPRLRTEAELADVYPLPVLARIPAQRRRLWPLQRRAHPDPWHEPHEGFRSLHVQLAHRTRTSRAIMITSASARDGKTTSAIDLALTMAAAGQEGILMDLDLRGEGLTSALGAETVDGLLSLAYDPKRLARLLVPIPSAPSLAFIGAGLGAGNATLVRDFTDTFPSILNEAKRLADFVIIDTPPLGEVSDALMLAGDVDKIVVVARLGNTRRGQFADMRDLLDRAGYLAEGLVVIGGNVPTSGYYGYGERRTREARPTDARAARVPGD